MHRTIISLAFPLLCLSACEKDFDEKYQDNLDQLNAEAEAIESGVNRHLSEGRKADEIMESAKQTEEASGATQ
ncbi:hypothetical protein [Sphingorhabdus sp. 109]|jgi:hypothetical protein|uniref:hypothetical protein n=1 Tax=Sphingorhabdus sp. 109 TaxID=2653173 RepID=UPI0012F16C84|nr:hypothetical protein [Sphingorhabdus sp. 109]VWX58403.1 conserved hypothetical protein [Sphingorhabdus sp. 109]